jgi:asparagine synthase (glutamine-hydrolysing)
MCGISGYWGPDPKIAAQLGASLDTIGHRGPNDRGTHVTTEVAMGMTRLSVIDLEGGRQPVYNEDRTVAVVFNGEIYNYRELIPDLVARGHTFTTHSDTEVLVHLYEEHGTSMVDHLRGMFAFAIHDAPNGLLFLARDRFGKKPLFYRAHGDGLTFASEIKALKPYARAAGERWTVSRQAVADYLSLGVVPQPSTIYEGVFCVPAGTCATFRHGRLDIQSYWSPAYGPKTDLTYAGAQAETRRLISESVRLRLRSDVPLGVFLSGGVDSSAIAYEAAQVLGPDLQCFTVSTGGELDESGLAAQTARLLGVQHHVLPLRLDPVEGIQTVVRHYDQPFADSSAIPSLQIAKMAAEHVTVVLNGDGGDEVFAGYRRYVAAASASRFSWIPRPVAARMADTLGSRSSVRRSPLGFAARFARGLAMAPDERYLAWTSDMLREVDKCGHWVGQPAQPTERLVRDTLAPGLTQLDQQLESDRHLNLLSDLLVKMDMACMAHSLEARSPLLDHNVAEFAWRLPDRYRIRRGTPKIVLRDAYRDVLPTGVTTGAKRGFEIPMSGWLAGDLKPLLHDLLGSPNARVRSFVDESLIAGLLDDTAFADRNKTYLLYALLVLELWLVQEGDDAVNG